MDVVTRVFPVGAVILALTGAPAFAVGPSFDCGSATTPLQRVICTYRDLSEMDLLYAQAYYALRQQVGPAGWQALKVEAIDFSNRAAQQCGLPASSDLPGGVSTGVLDDCLISEYSDKRTILLSRLEGAALEEASRPIGTHVALQGDLQVLGFLPPTATVDGVYGAGTRSAILAWQHSRNLPETGFIGAADGTALAAQTEASVPPIQGQTQQGLKIDPVWEYKWRSWLRAHWVYPEAGRKAGEKGSVKLTLTVGPTGTRSVEILESSGFKRLDDAAYDLVLHTEFPDFPESMTQDWITLPLVIHYPSPDSGPIAYAQPRVAGQTEVRPLAASAQPLTPDTACRDINTINEAFIANVMTAQIEGRMNGLVAYTTSSIVRELNRYTSISPSGDAGVSMIEAARRFGGGNSSEAEINIQNRARTTSAALLPIVMNGCHKFPDYAIMDMIQGVLWRDGGYDDQPGSRRH